MKKLLLIIALAFLFPLSQAHATIAIVSHTQCSFGAAGTSCTTAAVDNTSATFLIAMIGSNSGACSGTVSFPSDSSSNTWTLIGSFSGGRSTCAYYVKNPTVTASQTYTLSGRSSVYDNFIVYGLSGVDTVSPIDTFTGVAGSTPGQSTAQPGSITPSVNNEMLITVCMNFNPTDCTIDSGFTIGSEYAQTATRVAYLIETTATAQNPIWTYTGATDYATAMMVAVKPTQPVVSTSLVPRLIINCLMYIRGLLVIN